jgi:hypothetical protein
VKFFNRDYRLYIPKVVVEMKTVVLLVILLLSTGILSQLTLSALSIRTQKTINSALRVFHAHLAWTDFD